MPESAIRFDEPLRARGRPAVGTALHHPKTLAELLTWVSSARRPDLAIVLVDADGDSQRKPRLEAIARGRPVTSVVAVAVQEFEAWLLGDHAHAQAVLGHHEKPGALEGLPRRAAKDKLASLIGQGGHASRATELRLALARGCDLNAVARACPAFADFSRELARGAP